MCKLVTNEMPSSVSLLALQGSSTHKLEKSRHKSLVVFQCDKAAILSTATLQDVFTNGFAQVVHSTTCSTLLLASKSAPLDSRAMTASACPLKAAIINAVHSPCKISSALNWYNNLVPNSDPNQGECQLSHWLVPILLCNCIWQLLEALVPKQMHFLYPH